MGEAFREAVGTATGWRQAMAKQRQMGLLQELARAGAVRNPQVQQSIPFDPRLAQRLGIPGGPPPPGDMGPLPEGTPQGATFIPSGPLPPASYDPQEAMQLAQMENYLSQIGMRDRAAQFMGGGGGAMGGMVPQGYSYNPVSGNFNITGGFPTVKTLPAGTKPPPSAGGTPIQAAGGAPGTGVAPSPAAAGRRLGGAPPALGANRPPGGGVPLGTTPPRTPSAASIPDQDLLDAFTTLGVNPADQPLPPVTPSAPTQGAGAGQPAGAPPQRLGPAPAQGGVPQQAGMPPAQGAPQGAPDPRLVPTRGVQQPTYDPGTATWYLPENKPPTPDEALLMRAATRDTRVMQSITEQGMEAALNIPYNRQAMEAEERSKPSAQAQAAMVGRRSSAQTAKQILAGINPRPNPETGETEDPLDILTTSPTWAQIGHLPFFGKLIGPGGIFGLPGAPSVPMQEQMGDPRATDLMAVLGSVASFVRALGDVGNLAVFEQEAIAKRLLPEPGSTQMAGKNRRENLNKILDIVINETSGSDLNSINKVRSQLGLGPLDHIRTNAERGLDEEGNPLPEQGRRIGPAGGGMPTEAGVQ